VKLPNRESLRNWVARLAGMSAFSLFLILIVSLSAQAKSADPASHQTSNKIRTETEIRLRLSEQGFYQLWSSWGPKLKRSTRIDLYFDVFKGENFLIRRGETRAKLRIQNRSDQLVVQKSWIEQRREIQFDGFHWNVTTRTSATDKYSKTDDIYSYWGASTSLLVRTANSGYLSEDDELSLINTWLRQRWPRLASYDLGTQSYAGPLRPAALVHKERWTHAVSLNSGKTVTLQLGRDSDVLTTAHPKSFELEIEFQGSTLDDENQLISEMSTYLIHQGLSSNQTNPTTIYDFFETLENMYRSSNF